MKIRDAWDVIAGLDIELVEQYSEEDYVRWHEAIKTLRPIFEIQQSEGVATCKKRHYQKRKNPRKQFELKTLGSKDLISEAHKWCLHNLALKDGLGIEYWVDEMFIITSSQRIIDKVNKHFGSSFSFEPEGQRIYFLS